MASSRLLRSTIQVASPLTLAAAARPRLRSQRALDAAQQAALLEEVLAAARDEAAQLLEQARAEAEALRQAAWQDGWRAGRDAGAAAVQQEAAGYLAHLAALTTAARTDAAKLSAQFEAALPELAIGIARKIVAAELTLDPAIIVRVLHEVLTAAERETVSHIRLAPTDYEVVAAAWPELWRQQLGDAVTLTADPQIEPGGCLVEVAHGALDARLPARFAEVARAFGLPTEDPAPESDHA